MMPLTTSIKDKWVDIIPPEVPVYSLEPLTIIVSVTSFVVLIAVGIILHNCPRQRAKRTLRQLAHDLHRSQVDIKPACYQIKQCLCNGFKQPSLQSVDMSEEQLVDWQIYSNKLTQYCFAVEPPTVAELDSIIHEALGWLNNKAVNT